MVEYEGRVELIPERDIEELRGFLKGINPEFTREEDSIILATARAHQAVVWTQDADFKGMPDVKYFPKT